MSGALVLFADVLVGVLLVATIVTSVTLSRRITRLKADESAMRRTIAELVQASESAERAIGGLRTTLAECDRTLAERLRTAERYAADLAGQVEAGEVVIARISQIVAASRHVVGPDTIRQESPVYASQAMSTPGLTMPAATMPAAPVPAQSAPVDAPPVPVAARSDRMNAALLAAQALTDRAVRRLHSGRAAA